MEQHVDYFRQLEPPRPYRTAEVDPKLHMIRDEVRQVFGHPELTEQPPVNLLPPRAVPTSAFAGCLGRVDVEPFGSLEVVHGDIFKAQEQAVLLPMTPNLMPYRGLGLEAFDRGGKELVTDTFNASRELCQSRLGEAGLQAGDTITVEGRRGVSAEKIMFVIMPWFWQGSPMDAAKRFRHCVHRALLDASGPSGFTSLALPNIGGGVFGYEPRASARTLLEEAIEALLQIEAEVPCYRLRHITFLESRKETAEALQDALTEVAHRWLPERRLTSAPEHWGRVTRRLVVLPAAPNFFWKRHRVKFKRHHGVVRNSVRNYKGNIRPWLWRAHKVAQPPPLMVFQQTGEVAPQEHQLKARPFYFRGVSHWLFPSRRSTFHALRKGSGGRLVAQPRPYLLREDVRPRL